MCGGSCGLPPLPPPPPASGAADGSAASFGAEAVLWSARTASLPCGAKPGARSVVLPCGARSVAPCGANAGAGAGRGLEEDPVAVAELLARGMRRVHVQPVPALGPAVRLHRRGRARPEQEVGDPAAARGGVLLLLHMSPKEEAS